MKNFYKKIFVGLAAGAIIVTGSTMLLDTANAASSSNRPRPVVTQEQPPRCDINTMAQELADNCNVSKDEILSYCNNGGYFHEACNAAYIAKLSGKSFTDVVNAKTNSNSWQQVAEKFGVTQEELLNERRSMMAERIAANSKINAASAMQLLQEGYTSRDIGIAAELADASGKDIHAVMDMKKINNRWADVAKELGVDFSTIVPQRPGGDRGMGYGRHHGHNRPHHGQGWNNPDEELDPGFTYPPNDCPRRGDCPNN